MTAQRADQLEPHARKRVGKACDRCRLKKAGCTEGSGPCKRCLQDNEPCTYTERQPNKEKTYSNLQAQHLEQTNEQMKEGIIKMFQILEQNSLWPGASVQTCSDGNPSVHDILNGLGVVTHTARSRSGSINLAEDAEELPQPSPKRARFDSYEHQRHKSIETAPPALAHIETPDTTPTMTIPIVANTAFFSDFSPITPPAPQNTPLSPKGQPFTSIEVPLFTPETAVTFTSPLMRNAELSHRYSPSPSQDLNLYSAPMYTYNDIFDNSQASAAAFVDYNFSEFTLDNINRPILGN